MIRQDLDPHNGIFSVIRRPRYSTVMGLVVKEDKRVDGDLYAAAGEALAEATFRSGDFGVAEGLYQRAAAEAGDRAGEARAIGGLGMTHHYRNIGVLIDG